MSDTRDGPSTTREHKLILAELEDVRNRIRVLETEECVLERLLDKLNKPQPRTTL